MVGVPVVPADDLGRRERAGQVLAGDTERLVRRRPYGPDDRVVALVELGTRQVLADLDTQQVAEAGLVLDLRKEPLGLLRALVVRGHAGADEAVRRRQPVEHVHAQLGVLEQLVGGVQPGRAGADHGHPHRATLTQPALGRDHRDRGAVGVWEDREVLRVQRPERLLGRAEQRVRLDGVHRAGGRAGAAVDAPVGVDVEHLRGGEVGVAGRGVDAVDGAGQDARGVRAARLGDDVRHGGALLLRRPRMRARCGSARRDRRCPWPARRGARRGSSCRCSRRASGRRRTGRAGTSWTPGRPSRPAS